MHAGVDVQGQVHPEGAIHEIEFRLIIIAILKGIAIQVHEGHT